MHGAPEAWNELRRRDPMIRFSPKNPLGRVVATKQSQHIADFRMEEAYLEREPAPAALAEAAGARTVLVVPMLKENELVGVIAIYRQEVRPFTDKQIALVQNFAAQAVIAIENARLLNELRQSLEQQTATADVLGVISSSPGDLEPVFQTVLENATRICGANFANLLLYENGAFRRAALFGAPPAWQEIALRDPVFRPSEINPIFRIIKNKKVVIVPDFAAEQAYLERVDPAVVALVEKAGTRSLIAVPMLKEDELVGLINVFHQEVRPFTDKQISLLQNFAAQAVIAIENTRLLNELRESLQQQTATADVLKVISTSPGELAPVFQSMLVKAVQICEAKFGVLFRCYDDGEFHAAAWIGVTPEYEESLRKRQSFRPDDDLPLGRLLRTKELVHTADELAEKSSSPAARYGGARSLVAVPMRKENKLVGAFVIYRTEVRSFTSKQIELVQNFAAQAVIAIENARLLNELRESLDRQTATADVLRVISSSPGDLEPVFQAMLDKAVSICNAKF